MYYFNFRRGRQSRREYTKNQNNTILQEIVWVTLLQEGQLWSFPLSMSKNNRWLTFRVNEVLIDRKRNAMCLEQCFNAEFDAISIIPPASLNYPRINRILKIIRSLNAFFTAATCTTSCDSVKYLLALKTSNTISEPVNISCGICWTSISWWSCLIKNALSNVSGKANVSAA